MMKGDFYKEQIQQQEKEGILPSALHCEFDRLQILL